MKKIKPAKTRGITLIEILIAIGVFGVIVFAVARVFVVSLDAHKISANRIQANFLMEEYLEKARSLRRDSWENISTAGRYIMEKDGFNNIVLTPTEEGETVDGFTRYLELTNVYRDTDGKIVDSGGTLDPSSIKTAVYIFWTGVFPGDLENSTILTRYLDNLAWPQTTEADFNAGTHAGTAVINGSGGEVVLGAGGNGDWCRPSDFIVDELDLPERSGVDAVSAVEGLAYTGTDKRDGYFVEIEISNDSPPVASIKSELAGYQTEDVFVAGGYAYISTKDHDKDVVIIDLATNSEIGYYNATKHHQAEGVFVVGNIGYVIAEKRIESFDVTLKTGERPRLDWLDLKKNAHLLYVVGSYAYIAIEDDSYQMRIVNVSDPNSMTLGAKAKVSNKKGWDVAVNETGTRAYLITKKDGSNDEFHIINTDVSEANKNNVNFLLSTISSYNTGEMDPKALAIVPGGRALLGGKGGEEYQVVNIANENSPVYCGGLNVATEIRGLDAVLESDNDAFAYIVTKDNSAEFKIIEGGPGGQYSASGTFESQTLDTAYPTAFNRFFVNFLTPPETNILFQVSAKEPLLGSCAGVFFSDFDFVGSDGTSGTYFSEGGAIPFSDDGLGFENPGQCFRTRAYLSTVDFSQSPVLYDFTVNYSP